MEHPADSGLALGTATWEDQELFGVANLDDDDENGETDWDDASGDDDDVFPLILPAELGLAVGEGGDIQVKLSGERKNLRAWRDGEILVSYDVRSASLGQITQDTELQVEFGELLAEGDLEFIGTTADGTEVGSMKVHLLAAPLILNNHMQPAELVMAMSYSGANGNRAFIDGFTDVLGDRFKSFRMSDYGWDVWIEDEIEFGTMLAPDGYRMDLVIDSIRINNGTGLDDLPEDQFQAPDFALRTWGSGSSRSQDSFGNLEVSPPVTVDGVYYPFGRIYYGLWNNKTLTDDLADMLNAQKVQKPFQLDVSFLCVGHVDEFTTFLPDITSERGFKLVVGDIPLAYEFLERMDRDMEIPQFTKDHGYSTIAEMLDDEALAALNDEIQVDYIDPDVEILMAELALTEDDIIRIPAIFEEVRGCGGDTVGLIPGTANMTVVPLEDGETHLFMPDPFIREDPDDQSADLFIPEIEAALPEGLVSHWLDDWENYHIMLGEVHCGSNTIRTPLENWWEAAAHLLGGEE